MKVCGLPPTRRWFRACLSPPLVDFPQMLKDTRLLPSRRCRGPSFSLALSRPLFWIFHRPRRCERAPQRTHFNIATCRAQQRTKSRHLNTTYIERAERRTFAGTTRSPASKCQLPQRGDALGPLEALLNSVEATGFEPATSCSRSRPCTQPITTICRTSEENRASVPIRSDINIGICGGKPTRN
jgi:hypothetical protein